jgi:hypothetical protein
MITSKESQMFKLSRNIKVLRSESNKVENNLNDSFLDKSFILCIKYFVLIICLKKFIKFFHSIYNNV